MQRPESPQNLTQERLKQLLHYDPETGVFTRLTSRGGFSVGTVAGWLDKDGYLGIVVDSWRYVAHRLAFLYMVGAFPERDTDHINGVRTDNRWANLRPLTRSENNHNIDSPRSHNRSGFLGVSWHKGNSLWRARIKTDREILIGYFPTPEQAHAAYLKAKDELHPTHRRLRVAA